MLSVVVAGEKEKAIAIAECVGVNSLVDCAQKWHQKCPFVPFGGPFLTLRRKSIIPRGGRRLGVAR